MLIHRIIGSAEKVQAMIIQIADASTEQSATAAEIDGSMQEIASLAELTAQGVAQHDLLKETYTETWKFPLDLIPLDLNRRMASLFCFCCGDRRSSQLEMPVGGSFI